MVKYTAALLSICLLMSNASMAQVSVPNAGFEQTDPSSPTKTLNWKAESNDFVCRTDDNVRYKGAYSMYVSSKTEGNHFFNEEFPFTTEGLKKYKFRCAVKTKNLKGAAQLGARVFNEDGGTITKTVFTLTENANQDWTIAEGIFVSEEPAARLRLFGNLSGTGEAWFDEVSITETAAPANDPSAEVMLYVHELFDIVYRNSVISNKNFIADIKNRTMYLCADSTSKKECYVILQTYSIPKLHDGHSFFTTRQEWAAMTGQGKHPSTGKIHHDLPTGRMLKEKIAYINVPMFISSDQELMQEYADALQKLIASFDRQETNGYIIDLSKNGGGNSLPMVAGVGPLIGNGICGYSFSGDGSVRERFHNNGAVGWDNNPDFQKLDPYQLKHTGKPIAVIYSDQTASSGEVTATAFIGLANTRSFGQQTSGINTRVDNFEMSDGAYLNLASGYDADRNRNKITGPIKPDVPAKDTEAAMQQAIKWIMEN